MYLQHVSANRINLESYFFNFVFFSFIVDYNPKQKLFSYNKDRVIQLGPVAQ